MESDVNGIDPNDRLEILNVLVAEIARERKILNSDLARLNERMDAFTTNAKHHQDVSGTLPEEFVLAYDGMARSYKECLVAIGKLENCKTIISNAIRQSAMNAVSETFLDVVGPVLKNLIDSGRDQRVRDQDLRSMLDQLQRNTIRTTNVPRQYPMEIPARPPSIPPNIPPTPINTVRFPSVPKGRSRETERGTE